jgi:hypothetical protein
MKDNLIIPVLALTGLLQVAALVYANPNVASRELLTLRDGRPPSTAKVDTGAIACSALEAADGLGYPSHC